MDAFALFSSNPLARRLSISVKRETSGSRTRIVSSFATALFAAVLTAAVPLQTGCTETLDPIVGTTSLRIELLTPAGTAEERLPDSARSAMLNISAINAQNQVDVSFNGEVTIYSHFLGSLTPALGQMPIASATLVNGVVNNVSIDLPPTYGPTFLWVEDGKRDDATFATGTSVELWYREPFLEDVSRPLDEMALGARENSPLEGKEVVVSESRYGARGRLVVNGVYAQGYTLSDVECANEAGTPPCVVGDYDSIFVFTFSRAEDQDERAIFVGQFIDSFSGGISEFNGLTEVGFPATNVSDTSEHLDAVPAPIVIDSTTLDAPIEMERAEASLVALENATMCPLDENFERFGQWKLDLGDGCDGVRNTVSVVSSGVAADFDPGLYSGQVMPRVIGALRPINIGSFNVWIIYPRSSADIELPTGQ